MSGLKRSRLSFIGVTLLFMVPLGFGIIRAIETGTDFRYLWLAAAAMAGSMIIALIGRGASPPPRVSAARIARAVAAGSLCAAGAALLLGATAGPGVAIVAAGFGLCTGTAAVLGTAAQS